jgi:hypothetical protein
MLILVPNTSAPKLLQYIDLIHEAICAVYTSLIPPYLNEKWFKLAMHSIPTDLYPDTKKGMKVL